MPAKAAPVAAPVSTPVTQATQPTEQNSCKVIGNPPVRLPYFIPRPKLREAINKGLQTNSHIITLVGAIGSGKTTELAALFEDETVSGRWDLIIWINGDTAKVYQEDKERCQQELSMDIDSYLANYSGRWLLLLNDVSDSVVRALPSTRIKGRIIITSREDHWAGEMVHMPRFTQDEAKDLFSRISHISLDSAADLSKHVIGVCEEMECYPIAVAHLAESIAREKIDPYNYVEQTLKQYGLSIVTDKGKILPETVFQKVVNSVDELAGRDVNTTYRLLIFFAHLDSVYIPRMLIEKIIEVIINSSDEKRRSDVASKEIKELMKLGILELVTNVNVGNLINNCYVIPPPLLLSLRYYFSQAEKVESYRETFWQLMSILSKGLQQLYGSREAALEFYYMHCKRLIDRMIELTQSDFYNLKINSNSFDLLIKHKEDVTRAKIFASERPCQAVKTPDEIEVLLKFFLDFVKELISYDELEAALFYVSTAEQILSLKTDVFAKFKASETIKYNILSWEVLYLKGFISTRKYNNYNPEKQDEALKIFEDSSAALFGLLPHVYAECEKSTEKKDAWVKKIFKLQRIYIHTKFRSIPYDEPFPEELEDLLPRFFQLDMQAGKLAVFALPDLKLSGQKRKFKQPIETVMTYKNDEDFLILFRDAALRSFMAHHKTKHIRYPLFRYHFLNKLRDRDRLVKIFLRDLQQESGMEEYECYELKRFFTIFSHWRSCLDTATAIVKPMGSLKEGLDVDQILISHPIVGSAQEDKDGVQKTTFSASSPKVGARNGGMVDEEGDGVEKADTGGSAGIPAQLAENKTKAAIGGSIEVKNLGADLEIRDAKMIEGQPIFVENDRFSQSDIVKRCEAFLQEFNRRKKVLYAKHRDITKQLVEQDFSDMIARISISLTKLIEYSPPPVNNDLRYQVSPSVGEDDTFNGAIIPLKECLTFYCEKKMATEEDAYYFFNVYRKLAKNYLRKYRALRENYTTLREGYYSPQHVWPALQKQYQFLRETETDERLVFLDKATDCYKKALTAVFDYYKRDEPLVEVALVFLGLLECAYSYKKERKDYKKMVGNHDVLIDYFLRCRFILSQLYNSAFPLSQKLFRYFEKLQLLPSLTLDSYGTVFDIVISLSSAYLQQQLNQAFTALNRNANNLWLLYGRASVELEAGMWEKAIEDFAQVLRVYSNSSTILSKMGLAEEKLGKFSLALVHYAKAQALHGNNDSWLAKRTIYTHQAFAAQINNNTLVIGPSTKEQLFLSTILRHFAARLQNYLEKSLDQDQTKDSVQIASQVVQSVAKLLPKSLEAFGFSADIPFGEAISDMAKFGEENHLAKEKYKRDKLERQHVDPTKIHQDPDVKSVLNTLVIRFRPMVVRLTRGGVIEFAKYISNSMIEYLGSKRAIPFASLKEKLFYGATEGHLSHFFPLRKEGSLITWYPQLAVTAAPIIVPPGDNGGPFRLFYSPKNIGWNYPPMQASEEEARQLGYEPTGKSVPTKYH
jgi:tetratricopeptide (TPR) repeat protein